ncbi:MAG: argininosuccinate lyase [Ignavibacteria bacterium]|nr:argininosuccinate lyase [Ignavibacteria bacterium]
MLWGGRFTTALDNKALDFSTSLPVDITLFDEDIAGSIAHVTMLGEQNIISPSESEQIALSLLKVQSEFHNGLWNPLNEHHEDIHSAIETRLKLHIGDLAGKLHTGRSRNDQVVTDLRIWTKRTIKDVQKLIINFQLALLETAQLHVNTLIPGYTHLQRAQPISLAFHLLAYVEMLQRDIQRFDTAFTAADVCPLGSGAMAGSTLPINRYRTAELLEFSTISNNAYDAVSDRDFLLDFTHACTTGMLHLSRLAEELIIWSSSEWRFITLSDAFTTGSSLMPQKKNPDMAELIRGKSASVMSQEFALKTLLKGLPLSYNRDLQEDKEPVFRTAREYANSLVLMSEMIASAQFHSEKYLSDLEGDFSLATDIADWLVLQGVPFREAHHITGEIVKLAEMKNCKLNSLQLNDFISVSALFTEDVLQVCDIKNSLTRKKTIGSPNPEFVQQQITKWYSKLS